MSFATSSTFTQCQYIAKENEEPCQAEQYSLCPHCNLWLCLGHNLEHQQTIQNNAHTCSNHANNVLQQLTELPIDDLYDDCKKKIDEWKKQMYTEIDACYDEMLQQLSKLHNELKEEVEEFKKKKINLMTHEIIDPLTHMLTKQKQVHPERLTTIEARLQSLQQKIQNIKNSDIIQMNCDELKLNGQVNFKRKHPCDELEMISKNNRPVELEVLKRKPKGSYFQLKRTSVTLGASSNYILTLEKPSTLLLFDTKALLRSIEIDDKIVWDISWSDTMRLFLIVGSGFHTYDIISDKLTNVFVDDSQKDSDIWSVTCHFRDLLLLYGSGIIEHYLYPSFTRKRKWSSEEYLEDESDLGVSYIRFNNAGILAMSIKQQDLHWRIDLFDTQLRRIRRGQPLISKATDIKYNFQFTPFINHEWLVMNYGPEQKMLLLLDENGTLKHQIEKEGDSAALMGENILVLRNGTGLHLYKLS